MRVQADELETVAADDAARGFLRGPAGKGKSELLVFVRGRNELVRVRLDADGGANKNSGPDAAGAGHLDKSLDLVERVDHNAADAGIDRLGDLERPICCCRARQFGSGGSPLAAQPTSSPPVQTSRPRPSSATQRAIAMVKKALPA